MSQAEAKKASERDLEISLAVPGDEETIASLVLEAFAPFREEYTPDAFDYTAVSAERVRERLPKGRSGSPTSTASRSERFRVCPRKSDFIFAAWLLGPRSNAAESGSGCWKRLRRTHAKRVLKSCTSTPPSSCPVRRGCTRRMDFMS